MKEIFEKAQGYKINSVMYKDLEDIGEVSKENIFSNENSVFIAEENNKELQIHWGAGTKEAYFDEIKKVITCIEGNKEKDKRIFIEFIPQEFVTGMEELGFKIVSHWVDYWVYGLQEIEVKPSKFEGISFIKESEYQEANEVLASCKGYSREFDGKFAEWIKEWNETENSCVLVAEINNKLVGVCGLNIYGFDSEKGAVLWLRVIGVSPEYQGKGIGYALIEKAFQWGRENGAKRSFLACDTENYNGINLYKKFGYARNDDAGQINMAKY